MSQGSRFAVRHAQPRWTDFAVLCLGMVALVAGLLITAVQATAQTPDSVDDLKAEQVDNGAKLEVATAELDDIRDRIEAIAGDIETAAVRQGLLADEITTLEGQVAESQEEMFALQERIDAGEAAIVDRARSIYMHGQASPVMELLSGEDVDTAFERASMVNMLAKQDQVAVEAATADQANIDAAVEQVHQVQAALVERRQQELDLRAQMELDLAEARRLQDGLEARVNELDAREAQLAAEIDAAERAAREAAERAAREAAEREAAAEAAAATGAAGDAGAGAGPATSAPAPSSGGRACPMDSIPQLFNDWGWPRGGGSRSHKGNDLYGDLREPVFAMASGVWDVQPYGNSAGNWAILRGDDGIEYWYMHLDGHAVGDGSRVSVGQQTAFNGWTGNAVGTVYHIHFEIHPGGGGAVDPYPYLAQVC